MNIWAIDEDPVIAARSLCDQHAGGPKHSGVAIGEVTQVMSDAWWRANPDELATYRVARTFGRDHIPHTICRPYNTSGRFARWLLEEPGAFAWTVLHGEELLQEHYHRRGCPSAYTDRFRKACALLTLTCPGGELERFAMDKATEKTHAIISKACDGFPIRLAGDGPLPRQVASYRWTYRDKAAAWQEKGRPMVWTGRDVPAWMVP